MPLFGKTSPEEMLIEIILVVLIAFLPSIIYMVGMRYVEKYEREPWGSMGTVFLWGATMGVVAVIIFRGMFHVHFEDYYPDLATDRQLVALIGACLITPVIAEIVKPVGLLFVRYDIEESEDGLIYGAVAGLGYAATENLLYGIFLMSIYGRSFFIYVIFVRSISVVLLNASTTALTGYGVSRATAQKHRTGSLWAFPLFLFAAIGMHSFFNYLMVSGLNMGDIASISFSLVFAIVLSMGLMTWIYFKIYRLDRLDEDFHERKEVMREMPDDLRAAMHHRRPVHHPHRGHPPDYYDRPEPRRHPAHMGAPPPRHAPRPHPGPHPGAHHAPRPTHHAPPHHAPPRHPPRARRVGPAPRPQPPPSVYVEEPRPGARRPPPKEKEPIEADWAPAEKKKKRKPEPKVEMEWEEVEEEAAVDWEEEEPRPAPKKPSKKPKKAPAKIEWGEDDEDEDDIPKKKSKGKDIEEDDWWFEDG